MPHYHAPLRAPRRASPSPPSARHPPVVIVFRLRRLTHVTRADLRQRSKDHVSLLGIGLLQCTRHAQYEVFDGTAVSICNMKLLMERRWPPALHADYNGDALPFVRSPLYTSEGLCAEELLREVCDINSSPVQIRVNPITWRLVRGETSYPLEALIATIELGQSANEGI